MHLIPQQQATVSPGNIAQLGLQLVQALEIIAQTQQEILNRVSAPPKTYHAPPPPPPACSYSVKPVYYYNTPIHQLDWLQCNGLQFNLDGTQKQKQQLTLQDIQEHHQMLEEFRRMHNL